MRQRRPTPERLACTHLPDFGESLRFVLLSSPLAGENREKTKLIKSHQVEGVPPALRASVEEEGHRQEDAVVL